MSHNNLTFLLGSLPLGLWVNFVHMFNLQLKVQKVHILQNDKWYITLRVPLDGDEVGAPTGTIIPGSVEVEGLRVELVAVPLMVPPPVITGACQSTYIWHSSLS